MQTVTDGGGVRWACTVTVKSRVSVESVTVCPQTQMINVGESIYLSATVCPTNATTKSVTWCSSDESVATVGIYTGKVTAKKAGSTVITAVSVDGGHFGSIDTYCYN